MPRPCFLSSILSHLFLGGVEWPSLCKHWSKSGCSSGGVSTCISANHWFPSVLYRARQKRGNALRVTLSHAMDRGSMAEWTPKCVYVCARFSLACSRWRGAGLVWSAGRDRSSLCQWLNITDIAIGGLYIFFQCVCERFVDSLYDARWFHSGTLWMTHFVDPFFPIRALFSCESTAF